MKEIFATFAVPEPRRWHCCSRGSGQRVINLAVSARQLTVGGGPD
jgi:hypothetical protein